MVASVNVVVVVILISMRQASEGSGEVEGREFDEDVELDAREYKRRWFPKALES